MENTSAEATSQPHNTPSKKEKQKKTKLREWLDAIVFAVVVATIVRWGFFAPYTIPTPSMEGTQLVGDFLFVSKIAYGPRTPRTILRVPLTDNKIWGTEIPAYLSFIQLPTFRIPGYTSVQRNDVVVFNFPDEVAPIDMKTHYIKRCVAVAGDKLAVKDGQLYINGAKAKNPPQMQYAYKCVSKEEINERNYVDVGINVSDVEPIVDGGESYKLIHATEDEIKKLKEAQLFTKIERSVRGVNMPDFGDKQRIASYWSIEWTCDNFGEITIPKRGMTIEMTPQNVKIYAPTIKRFDWNEKVEITDDAVLINGKKIDKYTFKQDYFFMMGDNRHNSLDSRYWGFVPEDHVVGRASITWLSLDPTRSLFGGKIRWSRMFQGIY
ncbi:MAG: signal peptidase I [Bacteroidetes bacterium]|nr:MAG: signal peptidase I [Bacteroidota bacterium]